MTDRLEAQSSASAARPAHESASVDPMERRIASDGEAYSFQSFTTYYGSELGLTRWRQCAVYAPHARTMRDSAEQPVATTASLPDHSAEQPDATAASLPEDSVEQVVATTVSHHENSAEQPVLFSWHELVAMRQEQACGGKAANAEQKRLRAQCFANNLWEIDLSRSTYDWRQLLKAMPEGKSRPLVGGGIVKFSFRLLENVRDHNYMKTDSGERHVFEITCVDGERWQLHFHKNGNMDSPTRIPPPSAMPQAVLHGQPTNNTLGSAARPVHEEGATWHLRDILDNTPHDNLPVGRHEAHMALATILQSHTPRAVPFAVDITASTAFPWQRWLRNVVENQELIGSGVVKVFALCRTTPLEAQIVFCHPDDTWTCAKPRKRLEYEWGNVCAWCREAHGWRACPTFAQAPVQTVSWIQTRAQQL